MSDAIETLANVLPGSTDTLAEGGAPLVTTPEVVPLAPAVEVTVPIVTVGRRRTATARVRLVSGTGKITINDRDLAVYFPTDHLQKTATAPLSVVEAAGKYDVTVLVEGSGVPSQAVAVSHGLARALEKAQPEWRKLLKRAMLLRRDPRSKERKKPGQPGARRRFQFSKR